MIEQFIRRPVLSLVISLLFVFTGILALIDLPVSQFPDIIPPSVVVTAKYTGANAQVCTKAVSTPLERAINGVSGMTYMTSVTSNNGTTLIQVYFKVGTDPDLAAVNVQNRVQTILDELPEEVIKAGVTTEKEVNSMLMYLNILSTDPAMDEKFIYNFADINILQEIKRIEGVGFAEIMGSKEYSMRIWLKPDRMLAYNVSTEEIIDALRKQNIEAAPGKVGEGSDIENNTLEYILKYTGKFFSPEQYEQIVIRAEEEGSVLKIKDVASVEFGSMSYAMSSKTDGKPSAAIMLKQRPGSNARDVIHHVKKRMGELQSSSFPPGMTYNITYDVSRFLDASIQEVIKTLFEAFILVFIVVFIFLQDFRSTLIPALAVPVALIGTFVFMQLFGFSINLLTLFALVLAIGIVVDNAIVVVEAVHAKMEEKKELSPLEATVESMKEITSAILAITLVMSAVFIPVAFLSGPVGIFYRQFSVTLAVAIVISGINALTLTPALCALLIKRHEPNTKHSMLQKFFDTFNKEYTKISNRYASFISKNAGRRLITLLLLGIFCTGTYIFNTLLSSGFIPTEDQGVIYVNVTTPAGSTVERTEKILDKIQVIANASPSVKSISTLSGYSLVNEVPGASYGMGMIDLNAWQDRNQSVFELIEELKQKCEGIQDAKIEFFPPPTVPGFGNAGGFELRLLNKKGSDDLSETATITNLFLDSLKSDPRIGEIFSNFNPNFPQYLLELDQDMAARKGIDIKNAMNTLQTYLGSYYATNFIRFGQMYKVMVQAHPSYRKQPDDLLKLYVKNNKGEMVPYSTFITMKRVYGPEQITRYNMYTSATINGDVAKDKSTGDAIEAITEVAHKVLPKGFDYEWTGMTREQIISGNQAVFIFLICLAFVYLILSAQYESFLLPIPVILSLSAGVMGAFAGLKLAGLENNIYAQVSLIMLIGLLGKNAILMIEFAEMKRKEGMDIISATREGAVSRLRPILMTSFAFISGLIPLCLAQGAGAIGNQSIGIASASGMLTGTILGLMIIPGLYVLFSKTPKKSSLS